LLWETLTKTGLTSLAQINFIMFADINLADNSNDREVWRFAQANQMLLLTDNRSDNEEDSLEHTIRDENLPDSLPVLTISNLSRIKAKEYRVEMCGTDCRNSNGTEKLFRYRSYFHSVI